MTPQDEAKNFGLARVVLGVGAMVMPGPLLRMWAGPQADTPTGRLFGRALGARDVALGLGAVIAVQRDAPVRGWVEGAALADAGDVLTTLLAWRRLPKGNAVFVLALAGGSFAYARRLATQLS